MASVNQLSGSLVIDRAGSSSGRGFFEGIALPTEAIDLGWNPDEQQFGRSGRDAADCGLDQLAPAVAAGGPAWRGGLSVFCE